MYLSLFIIVYMYSLSHYAQSSLKINVNGILSVIQCIPYFHSVLTEGIFTNINATVVSMLVSGCSLLQFFVCSGIWSAIEPIWRTSHKQFSSSVNCLELGLAPLCLTSSDVNRPFSSARGRWSLWAWQTPSLQTITCSLSWDFVPDYLLK